MGLVTVVALAGAGLTGVAGASRARASSGSVIHVPADVPTIQRAVDRAKPGALVLVAPGVYRESVAVTRPNLVIRGESRAGTVVDCGFSTDGAKANAFKVTANGVAIENLTARNCHANGFLWYGVKGYRGSYLTAIRNGDYGVYAFASTYGQFDHDYASGSPDAGFYIGQCYPCHAVITNVEAEWNGLGYSGTNAGGSLVIARSSFHDNRAGIVPNSGTEEANPPQRGLTIVGNTVYSNNNAQTAAIDIATTATGTGILVAGGVNDVVERNRVSHQDVAGIGVIPLPEKIVSPGPHARNFDALHNVVRGNVSTGSPYDLLLVSTIDSATVSGGNCFAANRYATSLPANLERVVPCAGKPSGAFHTDLSAFAAALGSTKPPGADFQAVALPPPPPLADLPHARTAPARPATSEPEVTVDVARVGLPPGALVN
ncbi:MAG TPA: right-handed parallel beta-helix repeat-containing protein [Acidimicrobiia bacterium]|nr:right-handed parallel beta-helix repeat-containing protein [Acidimicrobiia bacterium]